MHMGTVRRIAEQSLKGIKGTDFFSATQHCAIKMQHLVPLNTMVIDLKKFHPFFLIF